MNKEIKTPWGKLLPEVNLFPIYFLLFIYGVVYILPYGKALIGISWFDWIRSEDGPLEWIQFFEYAFSSVLAFLIFIKQKNKKDTNSILWFFIAVFFFLVAGEEISWGERIIGSGIDWISNINVQGKPIFITCLFSIIIYWIQFFEISCLFLGWFGWRKFKNTDAIPTKDLSLFFLFVALFYFYFDISWASTTQQIRNDQEIFEVLLSTGIYLHSIKIFRRNFFL